MHDNHLIGHTIAVPRSGYLGQRRNSQLPPTAFRGQYGNLVSHVRDFDLEKTAARNRDFLIQGRVGFEQMTKVLATYAVYGRENLFLEPHFG